MNDCNPPSSWYDPPEPRHTDGTRIKEDCGCRECHKAHSWEEGYPFDYCEWCKGEKERAKQAVDSPDKNISQ